MIRVGWLTDPHFVFLNYNKMEKFIKNLKDNKFDYIFISGDISDGNNIEKHLVKLSTIDSKICFCLGNHDYYHSSLSHIDELIPEITKKHSNLVWLDKSGIIKISDDTAVIGNGSWCDGREGDLLQSSVMLNDYILISDFAYLCSSDVFKKIRIRVDKAVDDIIFKLTKGFKKYHNIFMITHVPPWLQCSTYNGCVSDCEWSPHFVCKKMGEEISKFMSSCDGKLTVLCGHCHGYSDINISDNIRVITGSADYGSPIVNDIFEI